MQRSAKSVINSINSAFNAIASDCLCLGLCFSYLAINAQNVVSTKLHRKSLVFFQAVNEINSILIVIP
ncbi:MAG: hypothetical protein V7K24_33440 [Nostoc sp.]